MATYQIISDRVSDNIEHVILDGKVVHCLYRTMVIANNSTHPDLSEEGYIFLTTERRKIMGGEYSGYFEGRQWTNLYIKYLD